MGEKPLRSLAKSGKITKVKKKDKIKMKKQLIRDKLAAAEAVRTEAKQKKMREKTVVVGDIKPLVDHLNIIDELIKEDEEKKRKDDKDFERNFEAKETKREVYVRLCPVQPSEKTRGIREKSVQHNLDPHTEQNAGGG